MSHDDVRLCLCIYFISILSVSVYCNIGTCWYVGVQGMIVFFLNLNMFVSDEPELRYGRVCVC